MRLSKRKGRFPMKGCSSRHRRRIHLSVKQRQRQRQRSYSFAGGSGMSMGGIGISTGVGTGTQYPVTQQKLDNLDIAYPNNNLPAVPNPFLAYTGKGGRGMNMSTDTGISGAPISMPVNTNGNNVSQPSTGPMAMSQNWINSQKTTVGGGRGRKHRHRRSCKCGRCGKRGGGCGCSAMTNLFKGGGDNGGIPYPNGLVGKAWTPAIGGWPGVDGISSDRNHLSYNTYAPSSIYNNAFSPIDTQTKVIGANPPFNKNGGGTQKGGNCGCGAGAGAGAGSSLMMSGGKRSRRRRHHKKRRTYKGGRNCLGNICVGGRRRRRHNKRGGGGTSSNYFSQDLVNIGRQLTNGVGSAYNTLNGYSAPVNPLPWKDQLQTTKT